MSSVRDALLLQARPEFYGPLLCALYLRGAPRGYAPSKSAWPGVARVLLRAEGDAREAARLLRAFGSRGEALLLEDERLLEWAREVWESRSAITVADPEYPEIWLFRLGRASPPAFWIEGSMPSAPFVGVVGSRSVGSSVLAFSRAVGARAAELGYSVASGGAEGCDRAALRGAHLRVGVSRSEGRAQGVLEILPCGLGVAGPRVPWTRVSLCAPGSPFTTGQAMERNALIYAVSNSTVVAHVRYRQGGSWHGAISALRGRLGGLIVRRDGEKGSSALLSLGAIPIRSANDLASALAQADSSAGSQGRLPFSASSEEPWA